jgi:hypothetical protein
MDNIERNFEFPDNIFDDIGDGDGEFDYDLNGVINVDFDILIQLLNETMDEEPINVICEITEEVPLKKKPRLHFNYEIIEFFEN